jgi:UTP-glucose-1-phosphate uridylyltransferase
LFELLDPSIFPFLEKTKKISDKFQLHDTIRRAKMSKVDFVNTRFDSKKIVYLHINANYLLA